MLSFAVDRKYSEGFYNRGIGSVWVSNETRPEHFSKKWRSRYAKGEPNHSGDCLYLSASRSYKWRDTSCAREKGILCETNEVLCHGHNHRRNEGNYKLNTITENIFFHFIEVYTHSIMIKLTKKF